MIRLAFAGKGGTGKSSISGTFARLLARQGLPVLAVDSDPLPGMAYSLGVPVDDEHLPLPELPRLHRPARRLEIAQPRVLRGLLPDALLQQFDFWQSDADGTLRPEHTRELPHAPSLNTLDSSSGSSPALGALGFEPRDRDLSAVRAPWTR